MRPICWLWRITADCPRLRTILLEAACHADTSTRFEWTLRDANDSWRHVQTTLTNLVDDHNVQGLVMNTHDITEQKVLEEQLSHQAFHDSLTGLANRALFNNRVEHALRMQDRGGRCTVMMLDLDDFKRVNDSMGHLAGDELLVQVAQSIIGSLRPFDTAARFGGDEFAILLAGVDEDRSRGRNRDAAARGADQAARRSGAAAHGPRQYRHRPQRRRQRTTGPPARR